MGTTGEVDLSQVLQPRLQPLLVGILVLASGCRSAARRDTRLPRARLSVRASHTRFFQFQAKARPTGRTPIPVVALRLSAASPAPHVYIVGFEGHMTRYVWSARSGTTSTRSWCSMRPALKCRGARLNTRRLCRSPAGSNTIRWRSRRGPTKYHRRATGRRSRGSRSRRHRRDESARDHRVWNPKTGRPWYNAIVWQDTRTDRIVTALEPHRQLLCERTGLPPATYFSGTKL